MICDKHPSAPPSDPQGGIRICATNDQIQAACNTRNVKAVFVFNSRIHFIDFSLSNPVITQLPSTVGAINPVISPDGAVVAYTTGIAEDPPVNGNASVYICPLNESAQPSLAVQGGFVPRFDLASDEPVLVYSTCGKASAGKVNAWDGCGKVMKKNLRTGDLTTVFDGGSYFGGLSFDGRYLATAESSPGAFLLDLQNTIQGPALLHKLLIKETATGNDNYIELQTCNPSASSSRIFTDAMMYLDFSSNTIEDAGYYHPTLGIWDSHQRIFISRYDSTILRYYDAPQDAVLEVPAAEMGKGEVFGVKWNHPEWSNHPYYAAATISVDRLWKENIYKHTIRNEGLYLIDLKDSSYLKLAEVTDTSFTSQESILWPGIWVETPSGFAEDPAWLGTP